MAGDWIKVEHATLDKPEIQMAAELLGVKVDEALGIFFRYWVWLDKNLSGSCPDSVRNTTRKSVDANIHCPGFAAALDAIGWAKFDDEARILHIVNAQAHNGNTAKSRALDAKRKRGSRPVSVRKMSGSDPDKNGTREEKRREEKPKPKARTKPASQALPAPDGVRPEVWEKWKRARGKKLTPDAVELQGRKLAEYAATGDDPNEVIEQSIQNTWAGLFPLRPNGGTSDAKHERRAKTLDGLTGRATSDREPKIIEAER